MEPFYRTQVKARHQAIADEVAHARRGTWAADLLRRVRRRTARPVGTPAAAPPERGVTWSPEAER